MNIYVSILKAFLCFGTYSSFFKYLNLDIIEKHHPELYRLFSVLPELHASSEDKTYTPLDLKIVFSKAYPKADPQFYDAVFNDIVQDQSDSKHVESLVKSLAERHQALALAKEAIKVSEGVGSLADLKKQVDEVDVDVASDDWEQFIVKGSIHELLAATYKAPGFRWRLNSLNRALGSLRKGDFGFVFARPETGKTTFLASEMSFMATQLTEDQGPIVWFNNEEQGEKVKIRCVQAVLGIDKDEVLRRDKVDEAGLEAEFIAATGGKLIIFDNKRLTKNLVEEVCRKMKPSIIIFDQIDKIQGFKADRNDLELKELYAWARELASDYGPVIAVCQAGGSGEDKEWLTMNDVDSSKTSKQGEADWILGIGFVHDLGKEYVRYMHLSKNKLAGDEDTDPSMRHGKWACFIVPQVGRYKDFNNDGTV
jgi:replicative DNA helicase